MGSGNPAGRRQVLAATLEYFSLLPTGIFISEYFPLERWQGVGGPAGRLVRLLYRTRPVPLPWPWRRLLARLVPGYDPYLRAWLREAGGEEMVRRHRQVRLKILALLRQRRSLEAYVYFWSTRRSATSRRLLLPLYICLGGKDRPVLSTMGIFTWSGLLHALWQPLWPVYLFLWPAGFTLPLFFTIWLVYTLLGVPVAWYRYRQQKLKALHNR
ncbi:MAG: hypothetical protein PWP70_1117 [Moorella sp. (in: firmicutes)]|nr:hypothetical protein [Moorella sp. (in: firmicutes)]